MCPMCSETGWLQIAPVIQKVTGEGERAVVGAFAYSPCFVCFSEPNGLKVLVTE